MLVMRRRAGEGFVIGDGIEIQILEVNGSRVKIGIVAPESVTIVRTEAKITREENLMAARSMHPEVLTKLLRSLPR